ncbi:MAG TPA: response regulator transcription factor [Bryobacteraceae bacterium]|nr:response regulator transcription factor [Bryobacteraceae bacterium]
MIENRTILLIDDEPQIRRVLRTSLGSKGARVLDAASGEEGIEMLRRETVDLILLDLNMPGMGGLAACRAIRSGWDMPIVVVSVRDSDHDKVEALDAGADDYVSKPFSFDELMARMRAALRRSGFATDTTPLRISVPGLEVDFANRTVVAGGNPVRLTPTEFDILRYLVSQANKPVPHKRLLQAIWGPEYGDQIEYLRVFINQLRKKIEPGGGKPVFIATEPRIGYRFVLPETPSTEAEKSATTVH